MQGRRWYRLLAIVPAVGLLGGAPWANRLHPYVLGLPFLLFWIVAWVVLTSPILALIHALDRRHDKRSRADRG